MSGKLLRAVYRLVVPGGLILLVSALAMQSAKTQGIVPSFWHYYPYLIFGIGLLLSADAVPLRVVTPRNHGRVLSVG